eukprot:1769387-Amphidinium_carterae.1
MFYRVGSGREKKANGAAVERVMQDFVAHYERTGTALFLRLSDKGLLIDAHECRGNLLVSSATTCT